MFDGTAFGKEIVTSVKAYLERSLDPVLKRMEALEADVPRADADLAVPDDVCELVALAVRTMAEAPVTQTVQQSSPINIYTDVRLPEAKESIVNVTLPEQQAPVIHMAAPIVNTAPVNVQVDIPKRGKEMTTVTGWDKQGRITTFERQEVEDNG